MPTHLDTQALQIDSTVATDVDGVKKVTITCSCTARYAADVNAKDTLVFTFHAHPLGTAVVDENRARAQLSGYGRDIAVIAAALVDSDQLTVSDPVVD